MNKGKKKVPQISGNTKIWNYFSDLIKTKDFQNEIDLIRASNLQKYKEVDNYIHSHKEIKNTSNLSQEINKLCRKFGLNELQWNDVLRDYIIRYKIPKENQSSSCVVLDKTELGEQEFPPKGYYEDDFDGSDGLLEEIKKNEAYTYAYPIVIRISPYASEREIIKFIEDSYTKQIEPIQNKYKDKNVRIGKSKTKDKAIQERNNYIYENKHLPRKEIVSLVGKKFKEYLDYGHVSKIINSEKRKRKEV